MLTGHACRIGRRGPAHAAALAALVEAFSFARRLARRRLVVTTLVLDAAAVLALVASPAGSFRAALTAAHGLGILTTLALASGCIADDRVAGRLLLAATHPAPRASWIVGRWLCVTAAAAAVTALAAVAILLAGPGLGPARVFVPCVAAACIHVGALAALAVALSTLGGSTEQVLALLAVLMLGFVPPEVLAGFFAAPWLEPAARAVWTVLPTPWLLDRAQGWAMRATAPHPVAALALVAQAPLWLGVGVRTVRHAQLGARPL